MSTRTIGLLRQRMIDDMTARQLGPRTQQGYIRSCKRFAAFLKRSPGTATADDICRFQLDLAESGVTISNRNGIVTGASTRLHAEGVALAILAELSRFADAPVAPAKRGSRPCN